MPDYSIFILEEALLTVSGGGQLDGVTQGNGSHLVGREITLNSNAWTEVVITDNDPNFQDSDGSQRLDGAQSIGGVTYANGTRVEAEYGLTLSDGVNTWTVLGFNVNNSSPAYGTVEGPAFIGGPGGFPPVGVPLSVLSAQEGPNFAAAAYATPICYDRGALIDTSKGSVRVEDLRPGDRIQTMDNGLQPLRWIGSQHVIGAGHFAPVVVPTPDASPLRVSQQHRMLLTDPLADLLFGTPEVYVPAIALCQTGAARLVHGTRCEYFHLVMDRHEVIFANGLASESLHLPDKQDGGSADELLRFFPELTDWSSHTGDCARLVLKRHEAEFLLRLIQERDSGRKMRLVA